MTTEHIHSDDPRLTAYALNELAASERAEVEAAIERSPEAQTAVAELRETIGLVESALSREPAAAALSDHQRQAIATAAGQPVSNRQPELATAAPAEAARPFRSRYVVAGTCVTIAAALALALVVPPLVDRSEGTAQEADAQFHATAATRSGDELAATPAQSQFERRRSGAGITFESEIAPDDGRTSASGPQAVSVANSPHPAIAAGAQPGGLPRGYLNPGEVAEVARPQTEAASSESRGQYNQSGAGYGGYGLPEEQAQLGGVQGPVPTSQPSPFGDVSATGGGGYGAEYGTTSTPAAPLDPAAAYGRKASEPEQLNASLAAKRAPATADSRGRPIDNLAVTASAPPATTALGLQPGSFGDGNEAYNPIIENEFVTPTGQAALSTFSIDVDTASYSNVRRFLTHGQFPPPDAVRIEELLNYFRYDYPQPEGNSPFSVTTEIGVCPWNSDHRLARIGLKGREIAKDQRPPSNLVFLVDVSGSMRDENKLPLVQQGLEMLVGEMTEDDRVAIVTYAGNAGVKLPSTSGDRREDILSVIRGLSAGGSTNGEAGIHLAYTQAIQHFIDDGTNRVILCTDGDFNVGVSDDNELVRLIQDKARQSRVFLSIFGFGMGNLKDAKLEQLANKGNGQYAYVDSPREARKVFVEEMAGSLYTIAKDVKIQVEFNPARVGAYRLIGYENRVLVNRDFHDDTKDAGEIGAGHTVTALYELIPTDKLPPADGEPLKYQPQPAPDGAIEPAADASPESFTVKLRFKLPQDDHSTLVEFPVADHSDRSASPSRDFDWAASVAAFGLILRDSAHKGQADLDLVRELALGARGSDESGLRREFIDLVYTAKSLRAQQLGQPVPAPEALPEDEARTKAAVSGKYHTLLKRLHVPQDFQAYGVFNDFGHWAGTAYAGESNLPQGHWVYVYPHWYIWSEAMP